MSNIVTHQCISGMSPEKIADIKRYEDELLKLPQETIPVSHLLHGGMYSRTIMVPAGVAVTGSLMKISTILIIQGDHVIYIDDKPVHLQGYNVFSGSANRKQGGFSIGDTYVTMIFPTNAKTIEEAEEEFTDEAHRLASRHEDAINHITITGESKCLA